MKKLLLILLLALALGGCVVASDSQETAADSEPMVAPTVHPLYRYRDTEQREDLRATRTYTQGESSPAPIEPTPPSQSEADGDEIATAPGLQSIKPQPYEFQSQPH